MRAIPAIGNSSDGGGLTSIAEEVHPGADIVGISCETCLLLRSRLVGILLGAEACVDIVDLI